MLKMMVPYFVIESLTYDINMLFFKAVFKRGFSNYELLSLIYIIQTKIDKRHILIIYVYNGHKCIF